MKAQTIEEALQLVPEHIMLRPGEAKPGDEWLGMSSYTWHKIEETDPEEMNSQLATWRFCRRRIPEDVRESIARHILKSAELENTGVDAAFGSAYAYNFPFEAWLVEGTR